MSSPTKPKAHTVARHYKAALTGAPGGSREVVIRSFLTKGDLVEMISAEDTRTKDDAYIQGIRDEIMGRPPFKGAYARKMGLFHIATRRVSPASNDPLKRTTGPKKVKGQLVMDESGRPIYFPRMYILRMVTDDEKGMDNTARAGYRYKVLATIAHILVEHERNKNANANATSSPPTGSAKAPPGGKVARSPVRQFSPTKFHVPKTSWDMTPSEPGPLDWYITDQMVATVIHTIYVEEDIGAWHMFQENVDQADCFFSSPYSYVAKTFGFRNPGESSVREPVEDDRKRSPSVEQAFDAGDVLPLH